MQLLPEVSYIYLDHIYNLISYKLLLISISRQIQIGKSTMQLLLDVPVNMTGRKAFCFLNKPNVCVCAGLHVCSVCVCANHVCVCVCASVSCVGCVRVSVIGLRAKQDIG